MIKAFDTPRLSKMNKLHNSANFFSVSYYKDETLEYSTYLIHLKKLWKKMISLQKATSFSVVLVH